MSKALKKFIGYGFIFAAGALFSHIITRSMNSGRIVRTSRHSEFSIEKKIENSGDNLNEYDKGVGQIAKLAESGLNTSNVKVSTGPSTERRDRFCRERSRDPVGHDSSRHESSVAILMSKLSSTWKKFNNSCSKDFALQQADHFSNRVLKAPVPSEGPVGCQECDDFLDLFRLLSPSPNKVFVEIGANKGYDLISYYNRWTNFTTHLVWMKTGLHPGCPYYADIDRHVFPRVIAVEPSRATFHVLQELTADLPVCNLELIDWAIAATPGRTTFSGSGAGDETAHIRWPQQSPAGSADGDYEVRVETLDGLLAERGVAHVDFLAIDTEGWDAMVLDGAQETLRNGAVDALTFEFAQTWPQDRTLRSEVFRLDGLGYDCFFVGYKVLLKMTGEACWRDAYAPPPQFANILCVRRAWPLAEHLLAPFNLANSPARFSNLALF